MRDEREERAVRELGEAIGYGRMMQLAEKLWRERLAKEECAGGEHTTGPSASSMVPCQCRAEKAPRLDSNGHCDWCCGTGRVTKHVREMQRRLGTWAEAREVAACAVTNPDAADRRLSAASNALFKSLQGRR